MGDCWQAAISCIVPITLISFIAMRPPAPCGVAMTFMCTTVSTASSVITLAITGFLMSARTTRTRPRSLPRRHDVDTDHPIHVGLGGQQSGETAAEITRDARDEDDASHRILQIRAADDSPIGEPIRAVPGYFP